MRLSGGGRVFTTTEVKVWCSGGQAGAKLNWTEVMQRVVTESRIWTLNHSKISTLCLFSCWEQADLLRASFKYICTIANNVLEFQVYKSYPIINNGPNGSCPEAAYSASVDTTPCKPNLNPQTLYNSLNRTDNLYGRPEQVTRSKSVEQSYWRGSLKMNNRIVKKKTVEVTWQKITRIWLICRLFFYCFWLHTIHFQLL